MEKVKFSPARAWKKSLPSGRGVAVARDDKNGLWALTIGDLDNEEDRVEFCMTDEAFDAMRDIIEYHDAHTIIARVNAKSGTSEWVVADKSEEPTC